MKRLVALFVVAGLIGFAAYGTQVQAQGQTRHYLLLARGQGPGSTDFLAGVAASGGTVTAVLPEIGVVLADSSNAKFLKNVKLLSGVQDAAEDVEVPWISPNEQAVVASDVTAQGVNSEPYWGYQWNIRQIHADQTAAAGYLGAGARVAVLDAGIVTKHPDIAPNINLELSKSFVPGEGVDPVKPGFNHGTHVAGIIAAPINNRGTQGVAPSAEVVAVKVLRESGSGSFGWMIEGLAYAASIDADIANMSLGATFDRINAGGEGAGPLLSALNRAINYATAAGVLCVSAAGNEGVNLDSRLVSIPAQSGNGMAVAATGPFNLANFDRPASYTNYGQSVVTVAAPGGDFASAAAYPFDMVIAPGGFSISTSGVISYGYYFAAGTSMAAPHVSGLAALLVGHYGHVGPTQLRSLIEQSAVDILKPGADPYSGKGRIDALKALGQ